MFDCLIDWYDVGDVLSFTLPSTLSTLDTPCHMYGLYNACAANPKVRFFLEKSPGKCLNLLTLSIEQMNY